jgi:hypothetical protein
VPELLKTTDGAGTATGPQATTSPGDGRNGETMTMITKSLGEFGRHGGREVVEVVLVRVHSAEIRKLWRALDDADAVEEDRIFARLRTLGAVREVR